MEGVFNPVMMDILASVREQVRMAGHGVAAVLLVGGFGQSPYLRQRLLEGLAGPPSIAVLQPSNGWTAVARGAAMLGVGRAVDAPRGSALGVGVSPRVVYVSPPTASGVRRFDLRQV